MLLASLDAWAQVSSQQVLTADILLDHAVTLLPQDPIFIAGRMVTKNRKGKKIGKPVKVEVFLELGKRPATAQYTLRNERGAALEQLTVSRATNGTSTVSYKKGSPLKTTNAPALSDSVQNTDIRWSDLTFSFLWWRGGRITGAEEIKGQSCYVVEVRAPASESAAQPLAKLWLHRKYGFLIQAEECDKKGKPVRRLSVKSLKRFNEDYMIKDLDVETVATGKKTKLIIDEMQNLRAK
jgi:hypothetical protein